MRYDRDDDMILRHEHALLERMSVDQLRPLVALTGEKPPSRKADMAGAILSQLAGERLQAVWNRLDEMQRAAVAETVHSISDRFDASRFRAKYGRYPDWGSAGEYGRNHKPSLLCLFFCGMVMPCDLKQRLTAFVPAPSRTTVAVVEQLPATCARPSRRRSDKETTPVPLTVHERERAAQRELLSVLRLIDAGKITVGEKTRRPSSAAMAAVTAILEGGDFYPYVTPENEWLDENAGPIRAFAWPMLIQAGKLAQLSGTRLQLTKAGRKALGEPVAGTLRALWTSWVNTTTMDELSRIECVKGQTGRGKRGLTGAAERRESIDISLSECPAGAWISTDDFLLYMTASDHKVTVARDAWGLYISEQQYGSLGYDGSARVLDERYVLSVLLEYAATLGLIDVALIPPAGARPDFGDLWGTDELAFFSRYDGLMYLRLTSFGAWCLDAQTDYAPAAAEGKPIFRVSETHEIAALDAELEPADRLALNSYANCVSDGVWKLDSAKLLSAIAEGRPVKEIREFLENRSLAAIPRAVDDLLDEAAERSMAFRDGGLARLIECSDGALAARIAGEAKMRKLCWLAGERRLVVPIASETAFRRVLRELGYLVAEASVRPARAKRASPEATPD